MSKGESVWPRGQLPEGRGVCQVDSGCLPYLLGGDNIRRSFSAPELSMRFHFILLIAFFSVPAL